MAYTWLAISLSIPVLAIALIAVTFALKKVLWPYQLGISILLASLVGVYFLNTQNPSNHDPWISYWSDWTIQLGWASAVVSTVMIFARKQKPWGKSPSTKSAVPPPGRTMKIVMAACVIAMLGIVAILALGTGL